MSTQFFTNSPDRTLFDKFKGIIEGMKDIYAFHAVVGYFRSSGYFALQPYLENLQEIKILVGINVDHMFAEAPRKGIKKTVMLPFVAQFMPFDTKISILYWMFRFFGVSLPSLHQFEA